MDWLHASCGPLVIFGWLLWSIVLEGLFYCFIYHTTWKAHLVSSYRWTLSTSSKVEVILLYIVSRPSLGDNH
jgi:hypothetical protein